MQLQSFQDAPILVRNGPFPLASPAQNGVVMDHQHAVSRAMHVEFNEIDRHGDRVAKGQAAVFGPDLGATPVGGDFRQMRHGDLQTKESQKSANSLANFIVCNLSCRNLFLECSMAFEDLIAERRDELTTSDRRLIDVLL